MAKNTKISMMMASSAADAPLFNVNDTDGTGEGRVTCDGGGAHAPITFDGHFRALCPLCAALERAQEAEESAEKAAEEAQESADAREYDLEQERDRAPAPRAGGGGAGGRRGRGTGGARRG